MPNLVNTTKDTVMSKKLLRNRKMAQVTEKSTQDSFMKQLYHLYLIIRQMDGRFCIYKLHIPQVNLVHDLQFIHHTFQAALCGLEVITSLPFFLNKWQDLQLLTPLYYIYMVMLVLQRQTSVCRVFSKYSPVLFIQNEFCSKTRILLLVTKYI